jgi:hypothetical protein
LEDFRINQEFQRKPGITYHRWLNFLIGATLSHTGYARNRDQEFADKGIERRIIIQQLEELVAMINKTVNQLTPEQMKSPYPGFLTRKGRQIVMY